MQIITPAKRSTSGRTKMASRFVAGIVSLCGMCVTCLRASSAVASHLIHFGASSVARKMASRFVAGIVSLVCSSVHAEWKVDLSRRMQQSRTEELREPASTEATPQSLDTPPPSFFESLFQVGEISGEIVVLNTEKGFVPSTLRVKKGAAYQIHVVNVNEREKNVSFVLDSFSEHHATFYGKIKSFVIRPQKEGVFKFVSPETSAQGKLVVFPAQPQSSSVEMRSPASE